MAEVEKCFDKTDTSWTLLKSDRMTEKGKKKGKGVIGVSYKN